MKKLSLLFLLVLLVWGMLTPQTEAETSYVTASPLESPVSSPPDASGGRSPPEQEEAQPQESHGQYSRTFVMMWMGKYPLYTDGVRFYVVGWGCDQ